jgi:small subunit ribosomal protein S21
MLKVEINKNQNLEKALKVLKGKVIKTKQNEKLRARLEFVKPSVQKREQKLKAQYVQSKKTQY